MFFCWRSSTAEQLICNQQVAGSNPIASLYIKYIKERFPSGQREQTVNLSADAFGGSNPPLSTDSFKMCGNSSAVELQPSKLGVAGSNPVSRSLSAHVAQSAEHVLGKDEVTGSIPVVGLAGNVIKI